MQLKKLTKKVLPVVLAGTMVFGSVVTGHADTASAETTAPSTDFVTIKDGKITDIDMDAYLYYVAAGEVLKNAPAFTNQGNTEAGRNENNLFGQPDEKYGYLTETVWDLEADGGVLHSTYGTWDKYWAENGDLLTKQAKMTDSITFLAGDEEGNSDVAPYWWVRHGSIDRDTSFANQTLLFEAIKSNDDIKASDVKFAFNQPHTGGYDYDDAIDFMSDYVTASKTAEGEKDALADLTPARELTVAGNVKVKQYTACYLNKDVAKEYLTESQLANAQVNIYVPEGAAKDTPVLYMVDNSGWFNNTYNSESIADGATDNMAAYALSKGYIVVDAGLRARQGIVKGAGMVSMTTADGSYVHSPVTVADAKAVITYVRSVLAGNNDIFITGTSGGGALSVAIGANGNSNLFEDELTKIGAYSGNNSITGVLAYCPITDLGHADGSYEYTYAGTRQDLLDAGYTSESSSFVLSDSTMAVSPVLAADWVEYVNDLGIAGTDNAFNKDTLTATGTIADKAEEYLIEALQDGLDSVGGDVDKFYEILSARTVAEGYKFDAWSIDDADASEYTYTVDGEDITVACLTDEYLAETGDLSAEDYANALVNVYIPENATEDSPILYMVDNSGWRSNGYQAAGTILEEGVDYVSTDDGNMAAMAFKNGYIVVDAGLRARTGVDAEGNQSHAPVTVADAKAVVRYLKYNGVGNTDMIFITGTSGGGALSAAVGASGNSADFTAELETIGACMETTDDVYGVIAYCPITDLGHSDMSYDFTYAGTRQDLIDSGYTTPAEFAGESPHPGQYALNEISMELSPILASEYVDYVESLGIEGTDLAFDADTLTSSGELWDTMKALVIAALQKELDEVGPEAFEAALEERVVDESSYYDGTPNDGWQTDWIIYTDESKETISDIDADGYLYYVALGQGLKPAPAFTNDGIGYTGVFYNENNLFGPDTEAHGYISECVFDLSDLKEAYGTWDAYWEANGELITMQAKMVDSIAYLADEDGESDAAPYWYVRHGANDRDTGFANQTLLYAALADNDTIKTLDFAFVFGLGHTGGYAVDEVEIFMAKAVGADADDTYKTLYEYSPAAVEEDDSPKTGEAFPIAMVVVVVAAAAVCFTTRRKMA